MHYIIIFIFQNKFLNSFYAQKKKNHLKQHTVGTVFVYLNWFLRSFSYIYDFYIFFIVHVSSSYLLIYKYGFDIHLLDTGETTNNKKKYMNNLFAFINIMCVCV